jgi:hypothetical protein
MSKKMTFMKYFVFYKKGSKQVLLKYLVKLIKRNTNFIVSEGVDNFYNYIFCKAQQCLLQSDLNNNVKNNAGL